MADFSDYAGSIPILGPLFRIGKAADQRDEGERMRDDLIRRRAAGEFNYSTPDEIVRNLNLAKGQFLDSRLPGQSVAENKIRGNTSQAVGLARSVGRSPSDIIAGITSANANENMAFNDLATEAAKRQLIDTNNYQTALRLSGDYKDKEWAYNTYMPMMQDRGYAESLIGSGNANLNNAQSDFGAQVMALATNGMSDVFGSGGNFFGKNRGKSTYDVFQDVFGNGGNNQLPATDEIMKGLRTSNYRRF